MGLIKKIASHARYPMSMAVCLIAMGCALTAERKHPDYLAYMPQVRSVLCVRPEINIIAEKNYKLLWQDVQSRSASDQIHSAIAKTLSEKGYLVTNADDELMGDPDVRSIVALFRSVNRSIQLHTYGPQIFPAKQTYFDYSVGSVVDLLATKGIDALVLCLGRQTASSSNTKTWISIAIIEPQGRILWYAMDGAKEKLNLQNSDATQALVDRTLASLAGSGSWR